jgi:predicted nucleotidyltransferase
MPRENHHVLDARRLLTILSEAEVEFVIVGGMAAVAQGSAYLTVDLDICYNRTRENLERLCGALGMLHPQLRGAPAGLPFVLDPPTLKAGLNFTFNTDAGDIDLLGEVAGLGFYADVLTQAEEIEVLGRQFWVLTIEALIRSKKAAGREKDLRLIPELEALKVLREEADKSNE